MRREPVRSDLWADVPAPAERDPHTAAHDDAAQCSARARLPMRIPSADKSEIDEGSYATPPPNTETSACQVRPPYHIGKILPLRFGRREPIAVLAKESKTAGAEYARFHSHLPRCERGATCCKPSSASQGPEVDSLRRRHSGDSQKHDA